MITFLVRIEDSFKFEIRDSDLLYENFSTLNRIFNTLAPYIEPQESSKKCLILDADDVLWKGISGEEEIVLDDEILKFQTFLLDLYHRGVLLCLCSKNTEKSIDLAFSNPKMLLKKEHFAILVANPNNKATNISSIIDTLNLSHNSIVFADNSEYELGFVTLNLPELSTVKINHAIPTFYDQFTTFFASVQATSDLNRTKLYQEQKNREKEKYQFTSVQEYNQSLQTITTCKPASKEDCPRLSELSLRTHQFNLSDISYVKEELASLIDDPKTLVLSLSAKDKYGDMGIVGMAVVRKNTIEAFMLSCRVFDRDFELVLLKEIQKRTQAPLYGIYHTNQKNDRYMDFYTKNGVIQI